MVAILQSIRSDPRIVPAKQAYRLARRFANFVAGRDHWIRNDVRVRKARFGRDWADWVVAVEPLKNRDAVVYSFGLGKDISFDLALIERFGVTIHGFDPTPVSMAWLKEQRQVPEFVFHPVGLAGFDGALQLDPPSAGDASFHTPAKGGDTGIEIPVQTLGTIMARLGHKHIDVLKMDIEGAEYDVIEDLIFKRVFPDQILVEFHHGYFGIPVSRTIDAICLLRSVGFQVFDVSPRGNEFSLIHETAANRLGRY